MPPPPIIIHQPQQSSNPEPPHGLTPLRSTPLFGCLPTHHRSPLPQPISISPASTSGRVVTPWGIGLSPHSATTTTAMTTPYSLHTPALASSSCPDIVNPDPIAPSLSGHRAELQRVKSFPHTADLLGHSSEASSSRTPSRVPSPISPHRYRMDLDAEEAEDVLTVRPERQGGSPPEVGHQDRLVDLLRGLRERRERDTTSIGRNRVQDGSYRDAQPTQEELGLQMTTFPVTSELASNVQGRHRVNHVTIRPRIEPEPPQLAALDRDYLSTSGFNELGLIRNRYHPSAYRPRAEFMSGSSDQNRSLAPLSANSSSAPEVRMSASDSPMRPTEPRVIQSTVRSTLDHLTHSSPSNVPLRVSRHNLPSLRRSTPLNDPTSSEYISASLQPVSYTLSAIDDLAAEPIGRSHQRSFPGGPNQTFPRPSPALSGPAPSIAASIPPPRRSSLTSWDFDWRGPDRADSSPQRQMRADREMSRRRRMLEETIRNVEARGEERAVIAAGPSSSSLFTRLPRMNPIPRSEDHRERMNRLDEIRLQRSTTPPSTSSVRGGRAGLGLAISDLLRDPMDVDEPQSSGLFNIAHGSSSQTSDASEYTDREHPDPTSAIRSWDREVREVLERRLPADRPPSSPSTRYYRWSPHSYEHVRSGASERSLYGHSTAEIETPPRIHGQTNELNLWGEIPVDFAGGRRHDPMNPFDNADGSMIHSSNIASRRSFRLQRSFDGPETSPTMSLLGDVRPPTVRRASSSRGPGELYPPRSDRPRAIFDHDWLNRYNHEPSILYNSQHNTLGPPGHSSANQHNLFSSLQLKPDMSAVERNRVVQMVAKGVTRCPPETRRKMAENMLEHVSWADFGEREDMPQDEYCSVCHDEVCSKLFV